MSILPNKSRSNSGGGPQEINSNIGGSSWDYSKDYNKDLVSQANNVLFDLIFNHYKIMFNGVNKICCPLHHEKSPSFVYYKNTNSYWCFGCNSGSKPVDFVSQIDKISKQDAANKILTIFDGLAEDSGYSDDSLEKLQIMLNFSENINDFRKKYYSYESINFIENIEKTFDDLSEKYSLSIDGLKFINRLLKEKIKRYHE